MQILKLEILCNDLAKAESFYADVLGLTILDKSEGHISFQTGTTTFTFKFTEQVKPVYHVAFNIPHNQLAEALAWMAERVEIIDAEPGCKIADFINWNAKSIYFYDYNGNIMEFIARYDLNNTSELPFNGSSITCVSEIGLAADDVATECNTLRDKFGIQVFSKQPSLSNFIAMGDDDGLLILSKLNRKWYLTELPAQKYHTLVLLKNNQQIHSLAFYVNEGTNN